MKLGEKQEVFAENFGKLLVWVYQHKTDGWALRLGEGQRTKEQAEIYVEQGKGILNSLHRLKLAHDMFLSINGKVTWKTKDYKPLGDHWKSLHILNRWGGDFKKKGPDSVGRDPYHFSMEHQGRQ